MPVTEPTLCIPNNRITHLGTFYRVSPLMSCHLQYGDYGSGQVAQGSLLPQPTLATQLISS